MESLRIQMSARDCAGLFEARLSDQDESNSQPDEAKESLETQSARFNLWADNIGVYADGHASLDYRLLDHEDVADLIMDQLGSLQKHLKRLSTFSSTEESQKQLEEADAQHDAGYDTDTSLSTISSFSTLTSVTSSSQKSKAQYSEISPFVAIVYAVNRIHRLSMQIRMSSVLTQNTKAMGEVFLEDGIDVIEAFRQYTHDLLVFRYKSNFQYILERLSDANAIRRKRFLYRQRHQRKLKGKKEIESMDIPHPVRPSPSRISKSTAKFGNQTLTERLKASRTGSKFGASAKLSATTASKLNKDKYNSFDSVTISTIRSAAQTSQIHLDLSYFPPAPKIPAGASEFYCPYCCLIHPASERSGKRWRQHFLKDLEPFVCLIEGCPEGSRCYHDKNQWISHMQSHSVQFSCNRGHKLEAFASEAEYDEHILTHMTVDERAKVSQSQLRMMKHFDAKPAEISFHNCPICGFVPSSMSDPKPQNLADNNGLLELLNHIAHDLQYIALWSLVVSEEGGNDIPSDPSDLRIADESTQADSDQVSLTFELLKDERGLWQDEDMPPGLPDESLLHPPEGLKVEDEWDFIPAKKQPYPGHELDPKLENFVRRVQLERLLAEEKAADPILPCRTITARRNRDFYGRQSVLAKLEKVLHPAVAAKGMASSVTLTGPAGIGKTQIAMEFALDFENQFDVVLWVHADEESKLANDFVRIAIKLGLLAENSAESRDHVHARGLVKAWLVNPLKTFSDPENAERATWLMIFDHVIDAKIINSYWPTSCTSGSIIITSRRPMPWGEVKFPTITVEPFNPDESAAFLSLLTKGEVEQAERGIKLGQNAHHSPTQLTFLAKMITQEKYSLQSFQEASQDGDGKQNIVKLHLKYVDHQKTNFSDWAVESLEKGDGLLDLLSMLDPDEIPERMLTSPPDNIAMNNYPMTIEDYYVARAELMSYSFIARGKEKNSGNLSIHRLVQDAARRRMSKPYYREVFNSCVKLISEAWPYQQFTWRHSISRWPKCEELFPHIIRLRQFANHIPTMSDDVEGAFEYAKLTTDAGWYCHERGRSLECEEFCNIGYRICTKLTEFLRDTEANTVTKIEQVNEVLAEIHHNRGCIAAEMNRPADTLEDQKAFNTLMMEEFSKRPPGIDMRLAISYNQLGVAYMMNGDLQKGELCFLESIREMERLDDFERFKISLPQVNLASVYWIMGQYEKAEKIFLEGLADRMAKFGRNDRESFITGRFYHGLGNVKWGQKKFDESYDYHEKAREHYKVTLGRGHHRCADATVSVGSHHLLKGDCKTAIEYFDKALVVYRDRSIYMPEKTRALYRRGTALRMLGNYEEADSVGKECLRLYRQLVPDDARPLELLDNDDFDKLIVFWSR